MHLENGEPVVKFDFDLSLTIDHTQRSCCYKDFRRLISLALPSPSSSLSGIYLVFRRHTAYGFYTRLRLRHPDYSLRFVLNLRSVDEADDAGSRQATFLTLPLEIGFSRLVLVVFVL